MKVREQETDGVEQERKAMPQNDGKEEEGTESISEIRHGVEEEVRNERR